MSKTKKQAFLFGIAIFCVVFLADAFFWKVVRINGHDFLASTPFRQIDYEKGLGGRKGLQDSQAMLFKFYEKGKCAFWMRGMNFDIDIIWIADGRIVYIEKNFSAASNEAITPPVLADNVLEIKAGLSDKYGFKVGDKVRIY